MDGLNKDNEKAFSIMMKMGYKEGAGLGKNGTGMLQPLSIKMKHDKRGFGRDVFSGDHNIEIWNGDDKINIEEDLIWLESTDCQSSATFSSHTHEELLKYLVKDKPLTSLENEDHFCNSQTLKELLATKEEVFVSLDGVELSKARTRANQFETIKSAFFMNRAALKMANLDAATLFMFSNIDKDPIHRNDVEPYYFADVCGGPGGFTEYILWRKKWCYKGFGLTLKGVHDFKVHNSTCASDSTFRGYYGAANDGNICNPDNIEDYAAKILHETKNAGVHFMMSDGGFSVEGNEGIQEILSKQIYICQCLIGLEIVRKHGHFVTKLFDIVTGFSVGLIFLMYQCFDKVSILKPNSSRPANSERYFICSGLKDAPIVQEVRKYLRKIVKDLWDIRNDKNDTDTDITEIVPIEIMRGDDNFYNYIHTQNTKIAQVQIKSLQKLAKFCSNSNLVDNKQLLLRSKCLKYWNIPDKPKLTSEKFTTEDLLNIAVSKPEYLYVQPCKVTNIKELQKQITDIYDWIYIPLGSSESNNSCHIFAGVGSNSSYKLHNHKWVKVKGLKLVKGTLLYGELVTEFCSQAHSAEKVEIKSLHVIDALRLGDISLADLNFQERCVLIQTYCKAINFETVGDQFRVRPKFSKKLITIHEESLVSYSLMLDSHYTILPTIGYQGIREHFIVNSLLLLKTDENHYFNTTYVLRTQIFIEQFGKEDNDEGLQYEKLIKYVKDKL